MALSRERATTRPILPTYGFFGYLKAGTYYLVLSSPLADTGWQYKYPLQTNDTTTSGVTFLGEQYSYGVT
jgi:hypothetical protein